MLRWKGLLVAVLMVAGCMPGEDTGDRPGQDGTDAGTGQERYTFEGCEERTTYCPRDFTFLCAMKAIEQEHARGCTTDTDCVLVTPPNNCAGYGVCEPRPAVLALQQADYAARVATEIQRYCEDAPCTVSGSCAPMSFRAACSEGRCVASPE
jgi:hypothetical protein